MNILAIFLFLLISFFVGCALDSSEKKIRKDSISRAKQDSSVAVPVYSNARFKNVTVKRTGDHTFLIKGKAQIFEANFGWVIEDGHNELYQGHEMTDAGAPEWGNFSFTVNAKKKKSNSTLHIILFESSAKDGSRQHELPVLLY